jgi:phage-related protein
MGDKYDAAKVLKGFGGAGLVEDAVGDAYRAVYTVKFAEAVHLIETLMADRDKLAQIIASMYKWTDKSTDDILKAFKKG